MVKIKGNNNNNKFELTKYTVNPYTLVSHTHTLTLKSTLFAYQFGYLKTNHFWTVAVRARAHGGKIFARDMWALHTEKIHSTIIKKPIKWDCSFSTEIIV